MKDVVVIGGGASGLVAAIYSALAGNNVTIIERNEECAKKILVTGNGRCNYLNEDLNIEHYNSQNIDTLKEIITKEAQKEILDFFDSIGIVPKIKNGYYYPYSNQASSIKNALLTKAKNLNIEIINSLLVTDILKEEYFIINPGKENIKAKKVIIATGGMAAPKTGSDGTGYTLAQKLGHTITPLFPALVQLQSHGSHLSKWNGVRCEGIVTLYENGIKIKQELGEVQLTDYGISGICVFNISRHIAQGLKLGKEEEVTINFMPFTNSSLSFLEEKAKIMQGFTIKEILEGFLNYKLVNIILKMSNITPSAYFKSLTKKEKLLLNKNLTSFSVIIDETNSFDKAQVTGGGITLNEIDPHTMKSKINKNLYFTGEILDVDGECGGFNLAFAFITGMIAGKNTK